MKNFEYGITTVIYTMSFTIDDNSYYPDKDYICVSAENDEKSMNALINKFFVNPNLSCARSMFIIPMVTFDYTLRPLFEEIHELNESIRNWRKKNLSDVTKYEFIQTDDLQWCLKKNNEEFYLIQIMEDVERQEWYVCDEWYNVKDEIDADEDTVCEILHRFGYGSPDGTEDMEQMMEILKNTYGDSAMQIIAECIFEEDCQNTMVSWGVEREAFDSITSAERFATGLRADVLNSLKESDNK